MEILAFQFPRCSNFKSVTSSILILGACFNARRKGNESPDNYQKEQNKNN